MPSSPRPPNRVFLPSWGGGGKKCSVQPPVRSSPLPFLPLIPRSFRRFVGGAEVVEGPISACSTIGQLGRQIRHRVVQKCSSFHPPICPPGIYWNQKSPLLEKMGIPRPPFLGFKLGGGGRRSATPLCFVPVKPCPPSTRRPQGPAAGIPLDETIAPKASLSRVSGGQRPLCSVKRGTLRPLHLWPPTLIWNVFIGQNKAKDCILEKRHLRSTYV